MQRAASSDKLARYIK
jgi:hypothetical protein